MKKGVENFSDTELDIISNMSKTKGFELLKQYHTYILQEMARINEDRVDYTKEDMVEHGIRIGHKKAWGIDADIENIMKREQVRREALKAKAAGEAIKTKA
jgi:hypothetical protein